MQRGKCRSLNMSLLVMCRLAVQCLNVQKWIVHRSVGKNLSWTRHDK